MTQAAKVKVQNEIAKIAAEMAEADKQGKQLVVVTNANGDLKGYRLTSNHVRCHADRTACLGKIRQQLNMGGWKFQNGTVVAA